MKKQFLFLLAALILGACSSNPTNVDNTSTEPFPNTLTTEEVDAGWILLFDGQTAEHWRGYNMQVMPSLGWVIKDGVMIIEKTPAPKPEGFGGDIITVEQYGNFELVLDFMVTDTANSGIFYFVVEEKEVPIYYKAPEYQILDNATYAAMNPDQDFSISKHRTGDNYDLQAAPEDYMNPKGEWNTARIIHKDGHVEHWLNGNKCIEYQVGSPEWEELVKKSKFKDWKGYGLSSTGHIGLQDHQHEVRFRNIKIRNI